jgi:opacity protein-like surface antigen
MIRTVTSAAVMTLLLTSLAAAQTRSVTHGFIIGANGQGAALTPDNGDTEKGGGGGLDLAWGFRNGLSIFLSGSGSRMEPEDELADDYDLTAADFGVRYTFRNDDARLRPFAEVAVTAVGVEFQDVEFFGERSDVEIRGPAWTLGGGLGFYITPSTALDLGVRWSKGNFTEVEADGVTITFDEDDYDLTAARIRLGLRYHFSGN